MQFLAGARLLDLETTLGYQFIGNISALPLAASGSSRVTESFWDGIIGVKGRLSFGDDRKWFVPYYLEVGTGQSDLTWQRWWNWLRLSLGRRHRPSVTGLTMIQTVTVEI